MFFVCLLTDISHHDLCVLHSTYIMLLISVSLMISYPVVKPVRSTLVIWFIKDYL